MNLSRRTLLKGLAAGAAAFVLPPTLTDNAEAARRFWALDATMLRRGNEAYDPRYVSVWITTGAPYSSPPSASWPDLGTARATADYYHTTTEFLTVRRLIRSEGESAMIVFDGPASAWPEDVGWGGSRVRVVSPRWP